MMTFGERLRQAIQQNGLSIADYSRATGISLPHVCHYMGGNPKPGLDVLARMVAALPESDVRWLLTGLAS